MKAKPKDIVVEKTNELAPLAEVTNLSVNLTERAMVALQEQRKQLDTFVRSQLKEGINGDFAKIPGTPKPSLLKPGAEKLANLFKLGSRILSRERDIDREAGFAMFSYTLEIYHIPTGAVIAQCEGSANSEEKKNKNKPFADQLNSLGKMAQKRAYVGGIIMAVGASDFFSADLDDMNTGTKGQEKAAAIQNNLEQEDPRAAGDAPICGVCNAEMRRTKANNAWGCKNWNDGKQHDYIKD
jgi:hypothetical protein